MAKILDIIKAARRKLNIDAVGDTLNDEDAQEGLGVLNDVVSDWNSQGLFLYATKEISTTLTAGKNPHTIYADVAADINDVRPTQIKYALIRSSGVDYPLEIMTEREYFGITSKATESDIPTHIMYRPEYPAGKIYLYPAPLSAANLVMTVNMKISAFSTINDDVSLPEGYETALKYGLAIMIGDAVGKPQNFGTSIYSAYARIVRNLKTVNMTPLVPALDSALSGGDGFNIYRGW